MPERILLNGGSVPRRIGAPRVSFAAPGLIGELTLDVKAAGGVEALRTRSGLRDSGQPLSNAEIDQAVREVRNLESYNMKLQTTTTKIERIDQTTRCPAG